MNNTCLFILVSSLVLFSTSQATTDKRSFEEGCTAVLAAGNATRDGSIILAKNRDLSEYELQWLYRAPREHHPSDATVKLQYIEIPQVSVTWAWVGSKSHAKKWGVGMGINEWGVAVADNDAPTREPLEGEKGLHDNDICRLILERSKTAREGMLTAGSLIEVYGHPYVGEIYWVADSTECWIVECAGHHWAAVRITDGIAVRGNQFQITTHWDEGSEDLVEYAVKEGWCKSAEAFNFARCYSKSGYPYMSSQTRLERGFDLLEGKIGDLTREDLMGVLADHYEETTMYDTAHRNSKFRTVCNRRTVSAMVVHFKPQLPSEMQLMWYCMSSPCVSVFMPVYANVSAIPEPYLTGRGPEDISSFDPSSAWWVFKKLQLLVDENYGELHPMVRASWDDLYTDFAEETAQLEDDLSKLFSEKKNSEARRMMDGFVEDKLTKSYHSATQIMNELSGVGEETEAVEEGVEDDEKSKIVSYAPLAIFAILIVGITLVYVMKIRKSN